MKAASQILETLFVQLGGSEEQAATHRVEIPVSELPEICMIKTGSPDDPRFVYPCSLTFYNPAKGSEAYILQLNAVNGRSPSIRIHTPQGECPRDRLGAELVGDAIYRLSALMSIYGQGIEIMFVA